MKRQREISVADCIERVEREDIHQMDDFKSGLVPGMPACVEELILGYVLHDHWNCARCDRFYCSDDGCEDGDCLTQGCMACGMELCDDCAIGDEHDEAWMFCDECCENICGKCLHKCACDDPTPYFDNNCNGCTAVNDLQML